MSKGKINNKMYIKKMEIKAISFKWYLALAHTKQGQILCGYGLTHQQAIEDCLKDYKVIQALI